MENERRLELSEVLHGICNHVYFQPPSSVSLEYPCIVYKKGRKEKMYADNRTFKIIQVYDLTYITRNPDDDTPDKILELKFCSFNRSFVIDNLYHIVYQLYF